MIQSAGHVEHVRARGREPGGLEAEGRLSYLRPSVGARETYQVSFVSLIRWLREAAKKFFLVAPPPPRA